MFRTSLLILAILICPLSANAPAEVKSTAADHLSIRIEKEIKAPPDVVWLNLMNVDGWWSSAHTWSGDAKNLSLKAVPGGGFDETLPNGGFVRHMTVIYSSPEKMLRMSGVLGPLQEYGLQGTMTVALSRRDKVTVVTTTYHVSGHFPDGLDQVAPVVDKVLQEQFTRLATVVETTSLAP